MYKIIYEQQNSIFSVHIHISLAGGIHSSLVVRWTAGQHVGRSCTTGMIHNKIPLISPSRAESWPKTLFISCPELRAVCNSNPHAAPFSRCSQQKLTDRSLERKTPSSLRLQRRQETAHSLLRILHTAAL